MIKKQRNDSISLPALCAGFTDITGADIEVAISTIEIAWNRIRCGIFFLEDGLLVAPNHDETDIMCDFSTSGKQYLSNLTYKDHSFDFIKVRILPHDSATLINTSLILSGNDLDACPEILSKALEYDLIPYPIETQESQPSSSGINSVSDIKVTPNKLRESSSLQKLVDTTFDKYWKYADPNEIDTWEDQKTIKEWLRSRYKLSNRRAEAVEIICRPDFAKRSGHF